VLVEEDRMGARILVADDSITIQKVVELTFSREDFVLVQARSGEEALRKAKEQRPDLVLLDLVMPDRNGYEVCAALRADPGLQSVPIILLAGTFEPFDKDKGLRAGANDFVTKPFESQALIGKVKHLLSAKAAPPEAPRPAPVPPPPPRPTAAPPKPLTDQTLLLGPGGVLIPPAPPAAPPPTKAPPPPPVSGQAPAVDHAPRLEEISQDQLWALLESTPPPAGPLPPGGLGDLTLEALAPPGAAGGPAGLSLEDLAPPPAPAPGPGAAGGPGEMTLEELPATPTTSPGEAPSLEVPAMEFEPAKPGPPEVVPVEPVAGQDVGISAAEGLSLEDLLSGIPMAPPPTVEPEPVPLETEAAPPVYDLSADVEAPPLPMVEVGAGPPPTGPAEDLIRQAEAMLSPPGQAAHTPVEVETEAAAPVYDLSADMDVAPPAVVEAGAGPPPAVSIEDIRLPTEADLFPASRPGAGELPEIRLGPLPATRLEQARPAAPPAALPPDLETPAAVSPMESALAPTEAPPVETPVSRESPVAPSEAPSFAPPAPPPGAVEVEAAALVAQAEPQVTRPVMVTPQVTAAPVAVEFPVAPPEVPSAEPAHRAEPGLPSPAQVPAGIVAISGQPAPPELAALRETVTERVAHELARDLGERLVKRIEQIVWEVVPDLAEILIAKEIERIREMAEGKKPS
jgi:CheY-like chemotaxis protein